MSDEAHLPDDPNENESSIEIIDENTLDAERIDESSAATLDKLSSKIEAIEASADVLDELSEANVEELIDDSTNAETEVDIDVDVLVKKAPPAPKAPRKPEWKQHLEQSRAEEAAQKSALLDERKAYEASIRAEKEAAEAARREELNKAQTSYKAEWQAKEAQREAAKAVMIERVRQEREQKEREYTAQLRGEISYPKPEAKAPYPSPAQVKENTAPPEKDLPAPDKVNQQPEKELPKAEKPQKPPAPPKAEKGKKKVATPEAKDKGAPKKDEPKKTGDELENRISRLSKPEE